MNKPKFKILSLDGGGMRGIIPCKILHHLESLLNEPVSRNFNLISGTSTGGIIATGLSINQGGDVKFTALEMLELYTKYGKVIFGTRMKDFITRITSINKTVHQMFKRPYDVEEFEDLLEEYFGDNKLLDISTDLLITTYDINSGRPFYFSSRLAKNSPEENYDLKTVARATSAAPTFFDPFKSNYQTESTQFIDGGVFANNPSVLGYAEGKELWKRNKKGFHSKVLDDNNDYPFFLLSIGTGLVIGEKSKIVNDTKLRTKDWIEPLLSDIFFSGMSQTVHYTMEHLLPKYEDRTPRYIRLNPQLDRAISMDDTSNENIMYLEQVADNFISENKETFELIQNILS